VSSRAFNDGKLRSLGLLQPVIMAKLINKRHGLRLNCIPTADNIFVLGIQVVALGVSLSYYL
jgi:hypothetical protein